MKKKKLQKAVDELIELQKNIHDDLSKLINSNESHFALAILSSKAYTVGEYLRILHSSMEEI